MTPAMLRNPEPWGSKKATYLVLSTPTPLMKEGVLQLSTWTKGLLQTSLRNLPAHAYQASLDPPGMSDGPYLAPSSPPLTPLPTNKRPFFSSSLQRLWNNNKKSFTYLLIAESYKHELVNQTWSQDFSSALDMLPNNFRQCSCILTSEC